MKNISIILFFILQSSTLYSQSLTLNELFSICKKQNWDEVNEYLVNKEWEYYESSKGDDTHYNTITWTYKKNYYDNKAKGWFHLYTYQEFPNKIVYSFSNKASYNVVKNGIANAGMKLIDNSIEDNALETKYSNSSFIVTFYTSKQEGDDSYGSENAVTSYSVLVIKKEGIFDTDNGEKTEYWEGNIVKAKYTLLDGKINGKLITYYQNGRIEKEGIYVNGKGNGKFLEYDKDGIKTAEYTVLNDTISGVLSIFEKGRISQEITKKHNLKNGKYVEYYYNTDDALYLKIIGNYNADEKNGLWQTILISDKKENIVEYTNYVNGVKNGEFKEYKGSDTLITGTYKNGKLNGHYFQEVRSNGFSQEQPNEKVNFWEKECEGSYDDNIKDGLWTYYVWGIKSFEGNFKNDKKTGKWTKYMILGNHIGSAMSEYNFTNNEENGPYKIYFHVRTINDSMDGGVFTRYNYYPVIETGFQKGGLDDGDYLLEDSLGVIISKGNYSKGKKNGFWIERDSSADTVKNYIYQRGNYLEGKRTGVWEVYTKNNFVFYTFTFEDDELNGKAVKYSNNKTILKVQYFDHDKLDSLETYDSLGHSIIRKYKIISEGDNDLKCRLTTTNDDNGSTISQIYWLRKDKKTFDYSSFDLIFILGINNALDCYPEGEYVMKDRSGRLIIDGEYFKNSKTGLWISYYYDLSVYIKQFYLNDKGGVEKYFDIKTKLPYSGELIVKNVNGKILSEIKISKGLRNGKSKYYDENGKVYKVEKYKDGVIIL